MASSTVAEEQPIPPDTWIRKRKPKRGSGIIGKVYPLKMKTPPEDPIRYCKAAWCPFKRQKPWFDLVHRRIDPF